MNRVNRIFRVFAVLAILALFAVVLSYAARFAPSSHFQLSKDPRDWADFGEYVGGTLGPIYGLLAFLGVLMTVVLQREQLIDQRKLFDLGELQRMMASISQNIDSILNGQPNDLDPTLRANLEKKGSRVTTFNILSAVGVAAMKQSDDYIVIARNEELRKRLIPSISSEIPLVLIQMQLLVGAISEYTSSGGSDKVPALYKTRYTIIVSWIHLAGLLKSEVVRKYFTPEEYLAYSSGKRPHEAQ